MRNWYVVHDYTNNRLGFTRLPGSTLPVPKDENEAWPENNSSDNTGTVDDNSGGSGVIDIPVNEDPSKPTEIIDIEVPVKQNPTTADYVQTGASVVFSVSALSFFLYKTCK